MAAKKKGPAKTTARNIDAAEKRVRAVQLRRERKTFREIGDILGFSPQRAHAIVTQTIDHLNALLVDETDALRQQQLDRIEWVTGLLLSEVRKAGKNGVPVGKVDRLIKLWEREARLAGTDAAEKYEHSGPGGGPIDIGSIRQRVSDKIAALVGSDTPATAPSIRPPAPGRNTK